MKPKTLAIPQLIADHKILVCCGSGGVGKTTSSAALALVAASMGKRAVVITIDPAKRLASSLGLKSLSSDGTDLTEEVRRHMPKFSPEGRFTAIMPDTSRTFEHFVLAMAGSNSALAKKILSSKIYKIFAKDFSGTNEYMAMEKLFQVSRLPDYDLIVLDTPPGPNMKAFLEAPKLLAEFFDDQLIKWFINPMTQGIGARVLAAGIKKALELMEKLTGASFITDLIEFTGALFELRKQFAANLVEVDELLRGKGVAFVAVTGPSRLGKDDTAELARLLEERKYPFWGFLANRMVSTKIGATSVAEILNTPMPPPKAVADDLSKYLGGVLDTERALLDKLTSRTVLCAEQKQDVHSIEALAKLAQNLARAPLR